MRSVLSAAILVLCLGVAAAPARAQDPILSKGQTLYVPVYSHIAHGNLDGRGQPMELLLSSMLSLRNTDPAHSVTVHSVRYYDSDGKLLREFLPKPLVLAPMASAEQFVEHRDKSGGAGANFLVEWSAERPVNAPVVETVNAYFFGTQSVAFTSPGRPIKVAP